MSARPMMTLFSILRSPVHSGPLKLSNKALRLNSNWTLTSTITSGEHRSRRRHRSRSRTRDEDSLSQRHAAEKQASDLGISVVDVRIKGIELPANTSNAIYQRMRADMQKIANKHRADGQAAAEEIRAKADADVMVLLAKTRSNAKKTRAIGQAQAASIYTDAYNKNKDFFALYRSLRAYEESFSSKKDILVLDQSSEFFNYFKQAAPKNIGSLVKK